MMKYIKALCVIMSFLTFSSICLNTVSSAEEKCINWYIKKKGHISPDFPIECVAVSEHDGYYIDKTAAENGEKIIYLTFDAGYENGNVEKVVNILNEYNVKGAFFILSQIILKNPNTVKKMFETGHLVCNHTKNHKNMSTLTKAEMKDNLKALEELCFNTTGYQMTKYFRFPEGKFSLRTLEQASEFGYKTFFWSLAYADWDNNELTSEAKAIDKIINNTHPGCILLMHPTSDINVKIMPTLIEKWIDMGYSFGTLDQLVARNS